MNRGVVKGEDMAGKQIGHFPMYWITSRVGNDDGCFPYHETLSFLI